jgi:hypothetical protein
MDNAKIDTLDGFSYAILGTIQIIFAALLIASFVVIRESKM